MMSEEVPELCDRPGSSLRAEPSFATCFCYFELHNACSSSLYLLGSVRFNPASYHHCTTHTPTHTHSPFFSPSSLMRQGLLCLLSARLRLPDPADPSAFLSEVIGSPCKYYTTMTGSESHSVPFPQCPWPLPVNRR